jgi:hypothetical protein
MISQGAYVARLLEPAFSDVIYAFCNILQWIFLKNIFNLIINVKRLLNSCIIGYLGTFAIVYDEKSGLEPFDQLLILPPYYYV